ncbi:MAG: hypothetical protein EA374_03980 [Acholeplasmatales bacterium]|nr:MAG: hypothetical protein EA374_03980 [Acholeplasmatales bacterium]
MEQWQEWIGYAASLIILISMFMRSLRRLRIINLVGALLFTYYGYAIGAYPVLLMNGLIVGINVLHLRRMYTARDYFDVLPVESDDRYAAAFIHYYREDIAKISSFDATQLKQSSHAFFVLRNMVPAGLFVVAAAEASTLDVQLDFATPAYRDLKTGVHVYKKTIPMFKKMGYTQLRTSSLCPVHHSYLCKMGFEPLDASNPDIFVKSI